MNEACYFIGGLLAHSREMALITNPLVNSYKRLVPGFDAPTELTWTRNNQNSLVRIPRVNGNDTRIELRSPDAASNPYLVFAVCLAAGLDGIQKKIYPTKASDRSLSESDQKEQGIENLPENLREAITLFEESRLDERDPWRRFLQTVRAGQEKRMAALFPGDFRLGDRGVSVSNLMIEA